MTLTRRVFSALPLLLCLAVAAPTLPPSPMPTPLAYPSVPPGGALVPIPGGTEVDVQLTDPISSSTANVGDTFAMHVLNEVDVNGWIVIPKGAAGEGEVLSVDRAGSHGHPGSLGLQMDWIFAADGARIRLTNQRTTQEGESKAGVASTVTILSWVFLGLPGLFAHNFVKGRDVVVDATHTFQEYVGDTVHVVATQKAVNAGFAH
jgi:hypothetical protein